MCLPSLTTTVWITTVSLHIASNLSILNSKPQLFEFSIFRMSNWNSSDLEAEDFDPNEDYSVQVQRKDGGLASTQVEIDEIATHFHLLYRDVCKKLLNPKSLEPRRQQNYIANEKHWNEQKKD